MQISLGMPRVRLVSAPGSRTAGRPDDPRLVDRWGRVATDLRVSLTDRCNLRCSYCMPPEGLPWLSADRVLTDQEVLRLITIAVGRLGVDHIRLTGGEPLLRRHLEDLVAGAARLRTARGTAPEVSLTTNGIGLARRAQALADAGLTRVNLSLDTLQPGRYQMITGRDRLSDALAGASAAAAAGLLPLKINAVLLRGVNDDEAPELARWALERGYELRFIEQMPLDPHGTWDRSSMITAREIVSSLAEHFVLHAESDDARGSSPARRWRVHHESAIGAVGVIASVTEPFCGACDRTRLTADGQVRSCLFASEETDLRELMRSGAADDELADMWRAAMWGKRRGHGIDTPQRLWPSRSMSAIGG